MPKIVLSLCILSWPTVMFADTLRETYVKVTEAARNLEEAVSDRVDVEMELEKLRLHGHALGDKEHINLLIALSQKDIVVHEKGILFRAARKAFDEAMAPRHELTAYALQTYKTIDDVNGMSRNGWTAKRTLLRGINQIYGGHGFTYVEIASVIRDALLGVRAIDYLEKRLNDLLQTDPSSEYLIGEVRRFIVQLADDTLPERYKAYEKWLGRVDLALQTMELLRGSDDPFTNQEMSKLIVIVGLTSGGVGELPLGSPGVVIQQALGMYKILLEGIRPWIEHLEYRQYKANIRVLMHNGLDKRKMIANWQGPHPNGLFGSAAYWTGTWVLEWVLLDADGSPCGDGGTYSLHLGQENESRSLGTGRFVGWYERPKTGRAIIDGEFDNTSASGTSDRGSDGTVEFSLTLALDGNTFVGTYETADGVTGKLAGQRVGLPDQH